MLCANGDFPAWNLDGRIHVTFLNSIFNYGRGLLSSCLQWALITVWQLQQMMKACLEMIEVYSSFALLCSETGPANFDSITLALINWRSCTHTPLLHTQSTQCTASLLQYFPVIYNRCTPAFILWDLDLQTNINSINNQTTHHHS